MESIFPHTPPHSNRRMGRAYLLLSLGLALLLFSAVILGSFHHHNDFEDHPDCAVCVVALHAATEISVPSLAAVLFPALPALFVTLIPTEPVVRPASTLRSRAPPQ